MHASLATCPPLPFRELLKAPKLPDGREFVKRCASRDVVDVSNDGVSNLSTAEPYVLPTRCA
jgi:hypothetical protein